MASVAPCHLATSVPEVRQRKTDGRPAIEAFRACEHRGPQCALVRTKVVAEGPALGAKSTTRVSQISWPGHLNEGPRPSEPRFCIHPLRLRQPDMPARAMIGSDSIGWAHNHASPGRYRHWIYATKHSTPASFCHPSKLGSPLETSHPSLPSHVFMSARGRSPRASQRTFASGPPILKETAWGSG